MKRILLAAAAAIGLTQGASASVVDTFDLNVTSNAGSFSNIALSSGTTYLITISGTFRIASDGRLADAEFYQLSPSLVWNDIRPPDIGVQVDGADVDWSGGVFNPNHIYDAYYAGTGALAHLVYNDVAYGDNVGNLQVSISAVPVPAAGLLLLSGVGGLALLRRRRKTA